MSNKLGQDGVSKRRLIQALVATSGAFAAGNAAPTEWVKPHIDNVFLPAHGATTQVTGTCPEFEFVSAALTVSDQMAMGNQSSLSSMMGDMGFTYSGPYDGMMTPQARKTCGQKKWTLAASYISLRTAPKVSDK